MTKKITHGLLAVGLAISLSGCFEHELTGSYNGECYTYEGTIPDSKSAKVESLKITSSYMLRNIIKKISGQQLKILRKILKKNGTLP